MLFAKVMCRGLIRTLGDCLKWFNDLCSKDYLKTGQGDFTAATTSGKIFHITIFPQKISVRRHSLKIF